MNARDRAVYSLRPCLARIAIFYVLLTWLLTRTLGFAGIVYVVATPMPPWRSAWASDRTATQANTGTGTDHIRDIDS